MGYTQLRFCSVLLLNVFERLLGFVALNLQYLNLTYDYLYLTYLLKDQQLIIFYGRQSNGGVGKLLVPVIRTAFPFTTISSVAIVTGVSLQKCFADLIHRLVLKNALEKKA